MNAEIITIGDEILIGQVVDTNSTYLASELNKLGIAVIRITSIPDIHENIIDAFQEASSRADLIISTGGLGPTSDDITKHTLAEYFNTRLVENPAVIEHIRTILSGLGVVMNERNRKQAELPENCELLRNSAGTAQGMWFTRDGRNYISLPGVPYEMKAIYEEEMEHRLRERFRLPVIHHVTILTHGVPESEMALKLHDWEEQLPRELKLAYLPSPGLLRLRLTGRTDRKREELIALMEEEKGKLEKIIGPHIFGYGADKLEEVIGRTLKEKGLTLSVAESCTGGAISSLVTSAPGASAYFRGGIVVYSNEIKTSELDVSPYTLMINGAVSQIVAEQMADGARARFGTDFSIGVTGIAGPTGGTTEKPVGTTWISVASKKRTISRMYKFGEDRSRNIQKATMAALFLLRSEIRNCL